MLQAERLQARYLEAFGEHSQVSESAGLSKSRGEAFEWAQGGRRGYGLRNGTLDRFARRLLPRRSVGLVWLPAARP